MIYHGYVYDIHIFCDIRYAWLIPILIQRVIFGYYIICWFNGRCIWFYCPVLLNITNGQSLLNARYTHGLTWFQYISIDFTWLMAKNIIVAIEWVMAHNPQLQKGTEGSQNLGSIHMYMYMILYMYKRMICICMYM